MSSGAACPAALGAEGGGEALGPEAPLPPSAWRADPVTLLERMEACRALIELGARPVIAAHVAEVSAGCAIRLYRALHGRRAPRGMLPCSAEWYFKSRQRRLEASRFVALHRRLAALHRRLGRAQALIAAWSAYSLRNAPQGLTLDRAWFLLRLVEAGEILVAACGACGASQVALRGEPLPIVRCVVCRARK